MGNILDKIGNILDKFDGIKWYWKLIGSILLIPFVGPVVLIFWFIYIIYRINVPRAYDYKKKPDDTTRNLTFEEAVGGCYFAAQEISKLNEQINDIDEIMSKQMKTNGIQNIVKYTTGDSLDLLFGTIPKEYRMLGEHYKPNKSYPESKKMQQLRAFPKETKTEFKNYPWRFNLLPRGSRVYILQENYNERLEKVHRFYFETFLPCKDRADELILDKNNREGELYKDYCNIIALQEELLKCTPSQRIRDFGLNNLKKIGKITLAIGGTALAATAIFTGMVNNAGKDIGYSPKSTARYRDIETGNLFDEGGNRVPW